MRNLIVMMIAVLAVAWASTGWAALLFKADFAGDDTTEASWPLKTGQEVTVIITVSNVPPPGLIAMGFRLVYDPAKLAVVTAAVDSDVWPQPQQVDISTPGTVEFAGFRLEGLAGDDIRLASMRLRCEDTSTSALQIVDRDGDWFVLFNEAPAEPVVLDGDIGTGVVLATIRPPVPWDVNGDQVLTLPDAILALQTVAGSGPAYVHGNSDGNGDGVIGLVEVLYILQRTAVARPQF
jgi:hypothetical protein